MRKEKASLDKLLKDLENLTIEYDRMTATDPSESIRKLKVSFLCSFTRVLFRVGLQIDQQEVAFMCSERLGGNTSQ